MDNTNSKSEIVANPDDSLKANLEITKNEYKKSSFDREFRSFVKQALETINARYGTSIEIGQIRSEQVCLNRYFNIYNAMKPEEHFEYFETLYNQNRQAILNMRTDDRWIKKGKLVIQFGQGLKDLPERCKQIRIMLSDIYLIACDLQTQSEKLLDGLDEKLASDVGGKNLIRPNILMLHLFRIFYILNDSLDKEILGKIVTEMENELGVQKKTVGQEPWTNPVNQLSTLGNGVPGTNTGISSIFTMATNMMTKLGYTPPEGITPPSEAEISNVISNVFNNETTQNTIQGMFSSLQGCQDFGSAVQTIV